MKLTLSFLITILITFFIGCFSNKPVQSFHQPVDENLSLDSTILGISVIADSLDVPWEIAWGPDDWIWITEQKGIVSRINPETGKKHTLLNITKDVWMRTTPGLLGMAIHPDQKKYPYVFINYTTQRDRQYFSRLVRYTYKRDTLINPKVLLEIPANLGHNGSRIALSGGDKLFWATGDVGKDGYAQDSTSLNGKILRLNIDGSIPDDNPVKGSYVWAWGFRNMQGLVMAPDGKLFTSEHGDAIEDEINMILPLRNYGWQNIEGFHDTEAEKVYAARHRTTEPLKSWTPTIAPSGIDYYYSKIIPEWENSLILTTLKGKSLRVLKLNADGTSIGSEKIFLENKYGRIRDICISPAGDVYISTSNRDWNPSPGFPKVGDDRILRIAKVKKADHKPMTAAHDETNAGPSLNGAVLYSQYCVSCHKEDGKGLKDIFPPLQGAERVSGNKDTLINVLLNGSNSTVRVSGGSYTQQMPAFNFLKDAELAALLTHIRSSWGNKASSINAEEVTKNRKQK